MTAEHLHLLLNHGPLFAVAFSLPLLVFGLLRRNDTVSRVSLVGLITAAALCLPVYFSGEDAEHAVEDLQGVSHEFLEEHEDAAKTTIILVEVLGALSAAVFFVSLKRPQAPRGLLAIVLVAAAGVFVVIAYTNNLGGKIRHSELRSGEAVQMNTDAVHNEH